MNILVDSSVWSVALRREKIDTIYNLETKELSKLIEEERVNIVGPIRQEVLSGIADSKQFKRLKDILAYFPDLELHTAIYERGAEFFNQCRKKGIQGSHIDFLICAAAVQYKIKIFTTDRDFNNYQKILPIKLHRIGD
jgi:predicted nucleic acid-binding protein